MHNLLKTLSLAIIAIAQISMSLVIYGADTGGYNVCLGNFCYHIAQGESQ
jgi:hypothetical protein